MGLQKFTSKSGTFADIDFGGGLNTTGGPLSLQNNESPDLQNIDFNKFGSILKRNGYSTLNSSAISGTPDIDGLYWFEYVSSGSFVRKAICVAGTKIFKMDDLDGTWDEITEDQSVTFTGSGLDDATSGGTYTGNGDIEYKVVIDATGTPDTFEWFKDSVSQASGVSITGSAQTLDNGLTITFAATTGHTLNDQWVFHPKTIITAGNHCDFETFLNEVYITNGNDTPFKWDGSGNASLMDLPTNVTDSKYVREYNNYLFIGNIILSGTSHKSRIYWSNLKDTGTWTSTDCIDVAKDDGEEITGLKVLADRLVIFKTRSIYILQFTGDNDIPFVLPGGGKTNSAVGCIAPFSIQEVDNGIVFLSYDGFYFFDGNNSFKISDRIGSTVDGLQKDKFLNARSLVQKNKNRYWCSLTSSGQTENDRILVWDYFLNAWSIYVGISASSMFTFYVDGVSERPYFGDYGGFVYRADNGANDNPAGTETAINAYYFTNWRHFGDLVNKKGVPQAVIYHQSSESILTFSYTYDFESGEQFSNSFSLSGGGSMYGTAIYDTDTYATEGGQIKRRDLAGRGRLVRFKFENSTIDETFQIDGLGSSAFLETNA